MASGFGLEGLAQRRLAGLLAQRLEREHGGAAARALGDGGVRDRAAERVGDDLRPRRRVDRGRRRWRRRVWSPGRSASSRAKRSATASSPARSRSSGGGGGGEALDRRAGAVAPARPALAGEQRQQRQPVGVGRHRGDRRLGLLRGGELREACAARRRRCRRRTASRRAGSAPRRRGSTTARAAARAARRARTRAARRSCRSSAPRAPCVSQPAPRLEVAPSPQAGNHGTSASAGQRSAHSPVRPERGASSIGGSLSSTPSSAASSRSHCAGCAWSSRPVPEAIETLAAASPSRRRWTYSPGETQVRTRSNVSGCGVAQPGELRGPVARVQAAAGAGVDRGLVEPLAQLRRRRGRSERRPSE